MVSRHFVDPGWNREVFLSQGINYKYVHDNDDKIHALGRKNKQFIIMILKYWLFCIIFILNSVYNIIFFKLCIFIYSLIFLYLFIMLCHNLNILIHLANKLNKVEINYLYIPCYLISNYINFQTL